MNDIVACIYRKDGASLGRLLQTGRQTRSSLDEGLRIVCSGADLEGYDQLRFAEMLMCAGASPNVTAWNDEPMLVHIAKKNNTDLVRLLINFAPDVDAVNDEDQTALHIAAENGNADIAGLLLQAGAIASLQDVQGNTPLMLSLIQRDMETLHILLADSDVNTTNCENETALHIAAANSRLLELSLLIEFGADVDAQDINGDTALMMVAGRCDGDTLKLLLDSGCDPNIANMNGNTALHKSVAAFGGNNEKYIIAELLEAGANINAQNVNGNTPLLIAIEAGNSEIVKQLIKANADVNLCGKDLNLQSFSPFELALSKECIDIVAMLLLAGCTVAQTLSSELTITQALFVKLGITVDRAGEYKYSNVSNGHITVVEQIHSQDCLQAALNAIKVLIKPPVSLRQVCRCSVRKHLGSGIKSKVEKLSLPEQLKDFLTLEEIESL